MMKMKKIWLSIALLLPLTAATAQEANSGRNHRCDHIKCDTRVQQLDSLVNYRYNEADGSFTPAYVIIYTNDRNGRTTTSRRLDLPLRTPVYNQIFYYDNQGRQTSYLYQEWKEAGWNDAILTEYVYDENNILYQETFSRKDASGEWFAYQRHFYTNEAGVTVSYLRQARNTGGDWYDVSHHYYVYDSAGNLAVLYGQYISNGEIFWKRTTLFDDKGKATERVLQTLKYDPVLKKNVLKNINHQTYSYDIYGDLHELFTDEWIGEAWRFTNKHIYYYSLIPGKKVGMCHHGFFICVSVNAVKAHLAHGDTLGPCPSNPDDICRCRGNGEPERHSGTHRESRETDYRVFPMPFTTQLQIDFTKPETGYSKISLCAMNGVVLLSERITGTGPVTLNTEGLKSGTYLLIISGRNRQNVVTVVKR